MASACIYRSSSSSKVRSLGRVASRRPLLPRSEVRSKERDPREVPWLELLALVELCKHEGAKAKDRQALAALVDRLPSRRHGCGGTSACADPRQKGGVDLARLYSPIGCCHGPLQGHKRHNASRHSAGPAQISAKP